MSMAADNDRARRPPKAKRRSQSAPSIRLKFVYMQVELCKIELPTAVDGMRSYLSAQMLRNMLFSAPALLLRHDKDAQGLEVVHEKDDYLLSVAKARFAATSTVPAIVAMASNEFEREVVRAIARIMIPLFRAKTHLSDETLFAHLKTLPSNLKDNILRDGSPRSIADLAATLGLSRRSSYRRSGSCNNQPNSEV